MQRTWAFALAMLGAGLALAGVGLMMSGRAEPALWAQALTAPGGASNVVVSSTPLGDSEVVICLVDVVQQRLAVYVADAKRSRLKLLAVRDVSADWALTDYNNDPPLPKDVRARVEKWKETSRPASDAGKEKPEGAP